MATQSAGITLIYDLQSDGKVFVALDKGGANNKVKNAPPPDQLQIPADKSQGSYSYYIELETWDPKAIEWKRKLGQLYMQKVRPDKVTGMVTCLHFLQASF
jgi:hypothetical protein